MKKFSSLFIGLAFVVTLAFAGKAAAQDTMLGKAGDAITKTTENVVKKTVSGTKAVYKGGKRVGYTVGNKTWNGTKWVASKSYKGGKWVAVKTVNGTKWVYQKARGTAKRRL